MRQRQVSIGFNRWMHHRSVGLGPVVAAATFTLLILPPPFIVPLFMPSGRRADIDYATNVLSTYTALSVFTFIAFVALRQAGRARPAPCAQGRSRAHRPGARAALLTPPEESAHDGVNGSCKRFHRSVSQGRER